MNKSLSDIRNDVRIAIDEIATNDSEFASEQDFSELNTIVDSKVCEAVDYIHLNAAEELMKGDVVTYREEVFGGMEQTNNPAYEKYFISNAVLLRAGCSIKAVVGQEYEGNVYITSVISQTVSVYASSDSGEVSYTNSGESSMYVLVATDHEGTNVEWVINDEENIIDVSDMLRFISAKGYDWNRPVRSLTQYGSGEHMAALDTFVGASADRPAAVVRYGQGDGKTLELLPFSTSGEVDYIARTAVSNSNVAVDSSLYAAVVSYLAGLVLMTLNDNRGENLMAIGRLNAGIKTA